MKYGTSGNFLTGEWYVKSWQLSGRPLNVMFERHQIGVCTCSYEELGRVVQFGCTTPGRRFGVSLPQPFGWVLLYARLFGSLWVLRWWRKKR